MHNNDLNIILVLSSIIAKFSSYNASVIVFILSIHVHETLPFIYDFSYSCMHSAANSECYMSRLLLAIELVPIMHPSMSLAYSPARDSICTDSFH